MTPAWCITSIKIQVWRGSREDDDNGEALVTHDGLAVIIYHDCKPEHIRNNQAELMMDAPAAIALGEALILIGRAMKGERDD